MGPKSKAFDGAKNIHPAVLPSTNRVILLRYQPILAPRGGGVRVWYHCPNSSTSVDTRPSTFHASEELEE